VGEVGGGALHVQEHLVQGEARERGELGEQVLPDQVTVLTAHPHHLRGTEWLTRRPLAPGCKTAST